MTKICGLDPSKSVGYRFGGLEGPSFGGVFKLAHKQKSQRDLALEGFLIDLFKGNGITDCYVEKPILPKTTSFQALVTLYGYATIVGLAGAKTGVNVFFVDMQTWRSEIGAPTQAPRSINGTDARREWVKQATMDVLRRLWKIDDCDGDDNKADAAGIYVFARERRLRKINEPAFDFEKDLDI